MLVGVLLAAGASSRMGRDKALVRSGEDSFAVHGVRHLWTACDEVIVVLGARAAAVQAAITREFEALVAGGRLHRDLAAAHRKGAEGLDCQFVVNAGWRRGMLSSARAGISAALARRPQGVLVLPVDHPDVTPHTVAALATVLLQALAANPPKQRPRFSYALIPRCQGERGHPVALTPALARAIAGDRRATDLSDAVRRNARLVGYLDVADRGVVRNRNTPRGGRSAKARSSGDR
jgi:CTP:molybdopterin cytidylyltransferase MocA